MISIEVNHQKNSFFGLLYPFSYCYYLILFVVKHVYASWFWFLSILLFCSLNLTGLPYEAGKWGDSPTLWWGWGNKGVILEGPPPPPPSSKVSGILWFSLISLIWKPPCNISKVLYRNYVDIIFIYRCLCILKLIFSETSAQLRPWKSKSFLVAWVKEKTQFDYFKW